MDRAIKAELTGLRDEVVSNLKRLETLVVSIDNKLQEADEVAVVARSPSLDRLLQNCEHISWHPDTPIMVKQQFEIDLKRVRDLWTVSAVERSEAASQHMIDLIKKLDQKLGGPPPGTGPAEQAAAEMQARRGVTDLLESAAKVSQASEPVATQGALPPYIVRGPDGLRVSLDGLMQAAAMDTPEEPATASTVPAPAWLRDIDSKSAKDILRDAQEWDLTNQAVFVASWNRMANTRVRNLMVTLDTVAGELQGRHYQPVQVSTMEEAEHALDMIGWWTAARDRMVEMLRGTDRSVLLSMKLDPAKDDPLLDDRWSWFTTYYTWIDDLVRGMAAIDDRNQPAIRRFMDEHVRLLLTMLTQDEQALWEIKMIDPETFEYRVWEGEQLDKVRARQKALYEAYNRDLARAWEFSQRMGADQPCQLR